MSRGIYSSGCVVIDPTEFCGFPARPSLAQNLRRLGSRSDPNICLIWDIVIGGPIVLFSTSFWVFSQMAAANSRSPFPAIELHALHHLLRSLPKVFIILCRQNWGRLKVVEERGDRRFAGYVEVFQTNAGYFNVLNFQKILQSLHDQGTDLGSQFLCRRSIGTRLSTLQRSLPLLDHIQTSKSLVDQLLLVCLMSHTATIAYLIPGAFQHVACTASGTWCHLPNLQNMWTFQCFMGINHGPNLRNMWSSSASWVKPWAKSAKHVQVLNAWCEQKHSKLIYLYTCIMCTGGKI